MLNKIIKRLSIACLGTWSISAAAIDLREVYDLALLNEHQLKSDQAAYQAGLEGINLGAAGLLPTVNAQATYSDRDQEGQIAGFGIPLLATQRDVAYSVSLTQPVFNMNAWFNYRRGSKLTEQAKAQYAADQQAFIIRVADAYFNVLRGADVLENAIARETALKHQLEQTQQRFEVGLTAITDVHDAQATYDSARADTLTSRNSLAAGYDQLEVITGSRQDEVAALSQDFPVSEPVPAEREEWVDFALANNNQLHAAKFGVEVARQNARAIASNHLPTVDAQLFANDNHRFEGEFDDQATGFTVTLNVPIVAGGGISASRRQASAQYEQSNQDYLQIKRDTIRAARSQHFTVLTDVATVAARAQAIISSESSLEATEAGFEVGTRDFVDVLNAQQGVFQARADYYNALYDYIINSLTLKQTAGTLAPSDIDDLNQWLDANNIKSRGTLR
jgi:outer membrane protein